MSARVITFHIGDDGEKAERCESDWDFDWQSKPICDEHSRAVWLEAEQLDDKPSYVVIGQLAWGSGKTRAEAKRNWKRSGGDPARAHTIMTFDAETAFIGVGGLGNYSYVGNAPDHEDVESA